jgi:hypothetical protein
MSFLVFPTWLYLVPVASLALGLATTLAAFRSSDADKSDIVILTAPAFLFAAALAYQEWRVFAYYGGPGGSGGWYLWAIALPEMVLLTFGICRRGIFRRWAIPMLATFLVLTVLGDLALICDSAGVLARTANGHIQGISASSFSQVLSGYARSRPIGAGVAAAGLAAAGLAAISWCGAVLFLARVGRAERFRGEFV